MQPPPVHVWLQIIIILPLSSPTPTIPSKHRFEQISTSRTLSADFDSIWTSVLDWEGGSIVKRITQNSQTRCSLTPCQLFSSIHPSLVPSFHLPVCGYLCLFSSFYPCQEDYIVLLSHVFPTHPPFLFYYSQFKTSSHLAVVSIAYTLLLLINSPSKFKLKTLVLYHLAIYSSDKLLTFHFIPHKHQVLHGCKREQVMMGMSKFTLGNKCVPLSLPWEQLSADPQTRKWSKTLVYEVSKSNERSILRWKLGRAVGVGGDTALHRGIPIGGWYGKGWGGGTPHISSRQREGINEAIKACSLRSIVGGRAG